MPTGATRLMTTPSHERAAALLRKQQSTTARLRAGLPALLEQLESMDEPALPWSDDDRAVDPRPSPRPSTSEQRRQDLDGSAPASTIRSR